MKWLSKVFSFLKDKNGDWSSLRVVLLFSVLVLIYQLYRFNQVYQIEIMKERIDYTGLSLLFTTMVINFIFVVILKVIQKKYER
jgi:uncharacterized membrane protein YidH (DUF202 family)